MLTKTTKGFKVENDAIRKLTIGAFKLTGKWIIDTIKDFDLKIAKDAVKYILNNPLVDEIKAVIFLSMVEFILKTTEIKKITKKYTENVYRGIKNTFLGEKIKKIVNGSEVDKSLINELRLEARKEIDENSKILKELKDNDDKLEEEQDKMVEDPEVIKKIMDKREKGFTVVEISKITKYPLPVVRRVVRLQEKKPEFTDKEKEERKEKQKEEEQRETFAEKAEDMAEDIVKGEIKDEITEQAEKILTQEAVEEVAIVAGEDAVIGAEEGTIVGPEGTITGAIIGAGVGGGLTLTEKLLEGDKKNLEGLKEKDKKFAEKIKNK